MELYRSDREIRLLFKKLGVRQINANEFLLKEKINFDLRSTSYYRDNFDEFSMLEEKYGKKLQSNYYAPSYVEKIDDLMGYGLFAAERIEKDELIGEYTGIVQEALPYDPTNKEILEKTEYAWDYPDIIPGLPELEINAGTAGSILRFVNHSFNPNLNIEHAVIDNDWKIFFIANKFIEKGTELLVDYGDAYWSGDFRTCAV